MPKLSDAQLIILAAAAQHDGGTVFPLPKSLKLQGGALTRVLESLRKKGLVVEQPAPPDAPAWRESEAGERFLLAITDVGLEAIGLDPNPGETIAPTAEPKKRRTRSGKTKDTPKTKPAATPTARPGTKQAVLIDLLKRKRGATIAEIVEATDWQPHSVRGAISGTLKKKLGLTPSSEKVEGRGRVYRIVAAR